MGAGPTCPDEVAELAAGAEAGAVAAVELPLAPVLLSGTDEASLRAQAKQLIDSAEVGAAHPVALGAASLRRAALAHRAVVLAGDTDELM
ncbi:hypothetical protein, partial [Streptomyces sp. BE303]|uniref:hypothetical protein n=1 Tax=Streptomyces sp. BE303 TaxID=3002528 RepID=UPI002E76CD48